MQTLRLTLAACILAACTNLYACSSGPAPGASGDHYVPHVLRIASMEEPDALNPFLSTYVSTVDMAFLWGEWLFNCDGKNRLVPEAATEVPTLANGGISRDGLTITYHIRRGIRWQDGFPLTAKDVVFSWQAVMNPRNNVAARLGYDRVASITMPNAYTAVLHMRERFSPIVNYFFAPEGGGPLLPAHILARYADINRVPFDSAPIGAGPFVFSEWVRGDHVTFVANPSYWRGKPRLSKIIIKWIPSAQTIESELESGDVDAWIGASPSMYPTLSALPHHVFKLTPSSGYGHLDFNLRDPLAGELAVRRAIALALDRRRIIHEATHDIFLPTQSDQPAFSWAVDRKLPPIVFDPTGADVLLDDAGWTRGADGVRQKNGRRLSLDLAYVAGAEPQRTIAAIIQQELKNAGIEIIEKPATSALLFATAQSGGLLYSGHYQTALFIWENGVDPDDSAVVASNQMPPAGDNSMFWSDPKVDAAERVALTTYDIDRRKAAYAVVQEEIVRQVPMVILFAEQRFDVYSDHFVNFIPCPSQSAYWNTYAWDVQ